MNASASELRVDCETTLFRTLDADLGGEIDSERSGSAKRICIATLEVPGPVADGDTGSTCHHLARALAGWGHEVVIAFVDARAADAGRMEDARAFCAGFGATLEPIVPRPAAGNVLARVAAPTWTFYDWLRARERPFDIVHVAEWRGLGYGALLAKSLGLAFGATHFVVRGQGPTLWAAEGSRQLLSAEHELGRVFMERRSVELADTLTCGSVHLLEWMRDAGYALPARSFLWPDPFPEPATTRSAAPGSAALEEVVFFGRLEPRKGLIVFVDAIDRLVRQRRAPARVTFLGGSTGCFDGPEFIREATRDWPVEVRTLTDPGAEEALAHLSRPGRLAVLPSLRESSSPALMECLRAGVPFIATAAGGTPELVLPADRARTLVASDHIELGERIAALGAAPLRPVHPRWDFVHTLEVWSRWHKRSTPFEAAVERFTEKARAAGMQTPLVTVCIIHHERPELVRMAVESVLAQDYPALEAVLVDDGSESAAALAALNALEGELAERGGRVIRQENRFKGAARNAAAAAAQGEWLLFLDDDNVLFPDAVSRLVRAALFSGADCVPAASIRFYGDGDPRGDAGSLGAPRRFLGTARAWSRLLNVVGDTCALVRREAFEAVGGFAEEYRVGIEDLTFFNHLVVAGHQIEPMPDPAYYYRIGKTSTKGLNRSVEAARARVLAPWLPRLADEERTYQVYAAARIRALGESEDRFRHWAEVAMRCGDWEVACGLWEELRRLFPDQAPGYVRGAKALLEAGRPEEAEALAGEAVAHFPEDSGGYVYRAEAAMRREDWNVASGHWAALRRAFADQASGYVRGAKALLEAGRLEEAEALAGEAVAHFPEDSGGYVYRAEAAMRREDWPAACGHWAALRHAFPEQAAGYVRGAAAFRRADRLEEAETVAGETVARFPDEREGYLLRAEIAAQRENWPVACEHWAALRRAFPDHAAGFVRGAKALLEAGRLEEAEALAGEAAARFPEDWGGYVYRAEAAMRREDWDVASGHWAALRRAFADQAPGYVRGAKALLEAGRLEEAEAVAGEAVARFPDEREAYLLRAEIAVQREDWPAACEHWAALRRTFPDQAPGYVRGAAALRRADCLEEAEALAGEAVARFPDEREAYLLRAEIAVQREDWPAACEHWAALRRTFSEHPAGYVRGAAALRRADRLEEAEALAGEAVARFPDEREAYLLRAEIAVQREDWPAACEHWAALRRTFSEHPAGYVRGAAALRRADRLEEAEALAGEAVARFPDEREAYLLRAEIAVQREDWPAACEHWAALRRAFPDHAAGFVRGAKALLEAGRLEKAEALAGEAVARFPEDSGGYVYRADAAMRREDWPAACGHWAALRHAFPDQAAGFVRGAKALLEAGRLEEAEAVAGEAVARFPEDSGSYVYRAEAAMRREDWDVASGHWAAMRRAFPEQAPGYVRGAKALLEAGRLEEAEAVAGEAVARFPEDSGGYVYRAEAAMRREDWPAACGHWAAMRRAFPEQAPGYVRGAKALLEAGRLEEAEAVAGEAVARFPEDSGGYVYRADAAMRREDWPAACAHWAALRHAFPDQAAGFVRGAKALLEAGRLEEAEAVAGEAVARFPEDSGGYVYRADAAMRREDWPAACAHWAAMRRAFPEQAPGYVRGAKALLEAGRLEEAEAVAGEAVARFPEDSGGYVYRADAAMRREDWPAACAHWAALRHAFPDQAAGFVRGAKALLEAGRLEEAEAVAGEAVARFPDV